MFYDPVLSYIGKETTVAIIIGGNIEIWGEMGGGSVYFKWLDLPLKLMMCAGCDSFLIIPLNY